MLKIGEFARISQVSIKALRHYDAIGLLQPAQIDQESGYRFYEMEQLGDLARILALKDCGFALDEIARLLRTRSALDIKEMLRQRIVAQEQLVAEEQARLHRITARLQQLERIDTPDAAFDVMLKQAEPLTLLGARRAVASTQEIGPLARVVWEQFEQHAVLPIWIRGYAGTCWITETDPNVEPRRKLMSQRNELQSLTETMNPNNVPLYQKFGFAIAGGGKVPDSDVHVWGMVRPAQAHS